jgi:hypothetical protein
MPVRSYSGNAKSTALAEAITATATTFLVNDGTGYPDGAAGPFVVTLSGGTAGEEKVLCATRTGTSFTVATGGRGFDDTTASAHPNQALVQHTFSATDAREANAHANATTGDPHPQYLLPTEADAAYLAKADNLAALTDKAAARENLGANAAYVAKADQVWQRLAEVRLAANGAITFNSIPATFRHLRLVVAGRSTNATADDGVFLRFNGDATAVYDWQTLRASGTAVTAVEGIGQTYLDVGRIPAGNAPAGIVGSLVIDLPDYAQTATQKTALSNNVNKRDAVTGGLDARQHVGTWRNTAALSQVQIAAVSGQLLSNTVATLYGTKGA